MLVPVDQDIALSIDLICTTQVPPTIIRGVVKRFDGELYTVQIQDDPAGLDIDARVILDFGADESPRMLTEVRSREGDTLYLAVRRSQARDKREFPRMQGGIHLRYAALGPAGDAPTGRSDARGWVDRGAPPEGAAWAAPDPFMDFSASGLKFDDRPACVAGDLLLMELGVPSRDERWRGLARVVRLFPVPPDQRERPDDPQGPTHQVAVEFLEIAPEATEALMEFTLQLQSALL